MKLHGVAIRIDPAQDKIEYDDDDWSVIPGTVLIAHIPSHITFEIVLDEVVRGKEFANALDFKACPIEICEGHAIPKRDDLILIGQQAIVVFLNTIGVCPTRPIEKRHSGEPDLTVN